MDVMKAIRYIRQCGNFDYATEQLERKGIEEICKEYSIDLKHMSLKERYELWIELLVMAEEVEYLRAFEED